MPEEENELPITYMDTSILKRRKFKQRVKELRAKNLNAREITDEIFKPHSLDRLVRLTIEEIEKPKTRKPRKRKKAV